jgi:hypothetical protein
MRRVRGRTRRPPGGATAVGQHREPTGVVAPQKVGEA